MRSRKKAASSYFGLSKGTALRLARYFGTDAQSWLNLQLSYNLKIAEAELKVRIERNRKDGGVAWRAAKISGLKQFTLTLGVGDCPC